jgi:hypothetical protein
LTSIKDKGSYRVIVCSSLAVYNAIIAHDLKLVNSFLAVLCFAQQFLRFGESNNEISQNESCKPDFY